MINLEGRRFPATDPDSTGAVAIYHQDGDLVWADYAGGQVRQGTLAGHAMADGTITVAYAMVLTDGRIVGGRSRMTPKVLDDGRIHLREAWRRTKPYPTGGVSGYDELPPVDVPRRAVRASAPGDGT